MKKLMVAVVGVCASLVSFAYDWSGKTGVVTITDEEAVVEESDVAIVAALDGIVLVGETSKVIFNNTSAVTIHCTITGDGMIVKRGMGDLIFSCPKKYEVSAAGAKYKDHFTTGGIVVETGVLKFPQGENVSCWYGPVVVGEGSTLYTISDGTTLVSSLNGCGTVTNTVVPAAGADNCRTLMLGYYGDTFVTDFKGRIGGGIKILLGGNVTLSNPESTFGGNISVYLNNGRKVEDLGILRTPGFGLINRPSPLGNGTKYAYDSDLTIDYGGKIFYTGGGETTDKRFRFGDNTSYANSVIDAGPTGGVTFVGKWYHIDNVGKMDAVYLRGSNTMDMVLANPVSSIGTKGGVLQFKKRGTGTWRLANHAERVNATGAWFVEEGTLKFDSIADVGENCAFGVATDCYPFSLGKVSDLKTEEKRLPYEIELDGASAVPTLEYSGANLRSQTNDRRIGLKGARARITANADNGVVRLFGGTFPADASEVTLYLGGTNAEEATIGNLSDGTAGGKLALVKDGAGEWRLSRDLTFTGPLEVREGKLTVAPESVQNYKWYKLTVTKIGHWHEEGDLTDCKPDNYYIRLRGLGLYGADGELYAPQVEDIYPANASSDATTAAGIYAADFWQGLRPGQITIGEYHGSRYCTYVDNLPSHMFANLTRAANTVYNTYLGSTPGPNNKNAWLPIIVRLPEDAPAIEYFDVLMDQTDTYNANNAGHIATFKLDASVDGINWDALWETNECVHAKQNCWASDNTIAKVANANCLKENRGFKIASKPVASAVTYSTTLNTVSSVIVAGGATLAAEGAVELPKLTVDCAGEGVATVKGFKIAETGVLTLANAPKGEVKLPVSFVDCTDLKNLEGWTATVEGSARSRYTIEVSGGDVTLKPFGMAILIR